MVSAACRLKVESLVTEARNHLDTIVYYPDDARALKAVAELAACVASIASELSKSAVSVKPKPSE